MKIQRILFGLLATLSTISTCMAAHDFTTQEVSFNRIYTIAQNAQHQSIFNSDFIFMLYPYSTDDKWVIKDIAQACVNYTGTDANITIDMCQNFVKDIIGVKKDTNDIDQDTEQPDTTAAGTISITTTPNTTEFKFNIYATGNYTITCGNNKNATVNAADGTYTCKYRKPGQYTITLSGTTTAYPNDPDKPTTPAISFADNQNIASIGGKFGDIFPTLPDGTKPIFYETFSGCKNLTSIKGNLFGNITEAPAKYMFAFTFSGCSGLKSIPKDLFNGITGAPAKFIFWYTFFGCSSLTSIPEKLFSGIQGAPAGAMFAYTFNGCSSLTSIPEKLFSGILRAAPKMMMFLNTFANCTSLTSIPENLFSGINGVPAESMFSSTFQGCNGLKSIPENLFKNVKGAPAEWMFDSTFQGCSGLKSIPENLFIGIRGAPADWMFKSTFDGCSSLTSIPNGLFKNVKGNRPEYSTMYTETFANCPNLSGNITPKFFGNITQPINSEDLTENKTFLNSPKIKFQSNK